MPALFPAPGGLHPDKLYDLLDAVLEDSRVVGLEVTAFEAPEDEESLGAPPRPRCTCSSPSWTPRMSAE